MPVKPNQPEAIGFRQRSAALRDLLPYLWPRGDIAMRVRVAIALGLLVGAKIIGLYVPLFFKKAVDALDSPDEILFSLPLMMILGYGLARLTSQLFEQGRDAIFERVAQRAMRRVSLRVFRHVHALSLSFHLERKTGALTRVIERGTKAIEDFLWSTLFNLLPTLLEMLLVTFVLWRMFDAPIALVSLGTVVIYAIGTIFLTEWRGRYRRHLNEADQLSRARALDSLLNYETVKYFNAENLEANRYDTAQAHYEAAAVKSQIALNLLNSAQAVMMTAGLVAVMLMAAHGIAQGKMTLGDFVLVNTYLMQLSRPLNMLGWVYSGMRQGLIDMESLFALLRQTPDISEKSNAVAIGSLKDAIRFENVTFAYDDRRPILQNVTFTVPAGKTVALVGASGAGKSTIARLLFRFYDVTDGSIRLDGVDIRDATLESLRRQIGVVPQDTVLFNDTLAYNIAYGQEHPDDAAIHAAAAAASLHDFIAQLPDGLETLVGERGLKLSGGEKQRVAIARVMLKSPSILILDEASSALDSQTERAIQQNLRLLASGRTSLVIAHRLSTIADADEILVLDSGQIIERGTHAALLALNGKYSALWQQQQEEQAQKSAA